MAYDEQLAGRVAAHFAGKKLPVEEKRMMGGVCFMVRGKMCVGVEKDRLMARIGPEAHEAALRTARQLATWLDLALAYNPLARSSKKRR